MRTVRRLQTDLRFNWQDAVKGWFTDYCGRTAVGHASVTFREVEFRE